MAPRAPDSEEPSHYNFSVGASGVLDCGPIDPGEYAFAACDSTDPNPVWWDLAVRGGANYPRAVLEAGQDTRLQLDLHLTGGATIHGTIRSNDEPVPGAVIHYQESSRAQDPWSESSVNTNDLGRYEIKLPHGGRYRIRVELDGVGESREIDLAPRARQEIDFALRTAAVEGTVSDPLELAGELLVFAIPEPGAPGSAAAPIAPRGVDVGTDRRFEFHHLSEGNYRFLVRNNRGSRRSGVSEPVLVQRDGMLTIPTIAVQRWVSLEIRLASRSAGPVQEGSQSAPPICAKCGTPRRPGDSPLPTSIFAWARLGAEIEIRCRLDGMSDWLEKRERIPREWPDFDKTLPIEIELP